MSILENRVRVQYLQHVAERLQQLQAFVDEEIARRMKEHDDLESYVKGQILRGDGHGANPREKMPMVPRRGFDTIEKLDGEVAG